MKPKKKKQLIISLIKDDLINVKLINGLRDLGVNAEEYVLHLSETIFDLMGFDDTPANEKTFEYYLYLTERVKYINLTESRMPLNELAREIYSELLLKNKQI